MADHICPSHKPHLQESKISLKNYGAEASFYTPKQNVPAGTATNPQPSGRPIPKLFQPFKLRGITLQNRIIVSPMCQYSADNGKLTLWHLTHLGGIIQRGPGLTIIESTAVTREGRISPEDSGLWEDSQLAPLKQLTDFAHSQGQHIGIQLNHGGRKASTVAPWIDRKAAAPKDAGGWPDEVFSVSDVPYDENTHVPQTLTSEGISLIKKAFVAAALRAVSAGFDTIEIHAAHGYLLNAFLSPATNTMSAPYGGSQENRMRLLLEIVEETREVIPQDMPLLVRVPGSDWVEGGIEVDDLISLSKELAKRGVDLIDVTTGGLMSTQKIISGPSYQAPFSKAVKKAATDTDVLVGAVGMITSAVQAEGLLHDGSADVVFIGRPFQKNTGLVWQWAEELGVEVRTANQIGWGFGQRAGHGIKVEIGKDMLFA